MPPHRQAARALNRAQLASAPAGEVLWGRHLEVVDGIGIVVRAGLATRFDEVVLGCGVQRPAHGARLPLRRAAHGISKRRAQHTAMQKGENRDREWLLNDGQIQNPSAQS